MSIKLKTNMADVLDEMGIVLNKKSRQAIYVGVKRAMQRTAATLRKGVVNVLAEEIALKKGEIKKKFVKINRAGLKKRSIQGLHVAIDVMDTDQSKGISLIRFIRGAKTPRKQKGVKVGRRAKVSATVVPGKKRILKKAFIAKVTASNDSEHYHVFRRNSKNKMMKQATPRPHIFMGRRRPLSKVYAAMTPILIKRIKHEIEWYLKNGVKSKKLDAA